MDRINQKKIIYPFIHYYLNEYTQANDLILDIGCGTSQYRHCTETNYFGIDLKTGAMPDGFEYDVDVIASAEAIPFVTNRFDLVFSVASFYQIRNHQKALSEIYRIIKPHGQILLFDYNQRTQQHLNKRYNLTNTRNAYPCWSQWELLARVQSAGFEGCTLLPKCSHKITPITKRIRLFYQEYRGSWAIVTGYKL
ncbi:class I SAM-dependent methyltransferase [candidate division KSB1 bacterium]|nr:class I SAM-dependent methyltransferase [candidate division KSB1 bacterium]